MSVRAESQAGELLIEAGAVLASSLELGTTMRQVAQLAVPELADVCVIDLLDEDGAIAEIAVAAADPALAAGVEAIRAQHPLDPQSSHPVARVIRESRPVLLRELPAELLRGIASGAEHAQFMITHGYRSAIVAPLVARTRTVGAISVLRVGERDPFENADSELVVELARRAALAIDNAQLFGALHRLERLQQAILAQLGEAITVEDEQGATVFANRAAADLFEIGSPHAMTADPPAVITRHFALYDEQARELSPDQLPSRRLFAGERAPPLTVRAIARATGAERWLIVRSSAITDAQDDRVVLVANVFEDITEVKRVQLDESFMAQASRVLASSMDYAETLRSVARLAVPQIADGCAIDLVGDEGEIEHVVVHHVDPARQAIAEQLVAAYGRTVDEPTGWVAEVIRSGEPRLQAGVDRTALASRARDDEHLRLLDALGGSSVMIVPLVGAVRTIGAITLISSAPRGPLTDADLRLAQRLARRAGTAVENARLYTERARIAHTLQRALLPHRLPDVPGASVAARYSAAGELNEVGGDFYDAFARPDGSWMLAIGDVVGKGAGAAGVTALARHTLRTCARQGATPTQMLQMLHEALRDQPPGADMCTACLIALTPGAAGASATVTLAGHPPPLLVAPDGALSSLGTPGTVLGVIDPVRVSETPAELGAGDTVLMYTDGLLDAGRREGARLGEVGLRELCSTYAASALATMLLEIEAAALGRAAGQLEDDIALLAIRLRA